MIILHDDFDELKIDFDKNNGLIPVIVQDYETAEILMLAYMNKDAFDKTLLLGEMVYFSRSKNRLWHKGETSGHVQQLVELRVDCDEDTLLAKVIQKGGAACHVGYKSCFYRVVDPDKSVSIVEEKVFDPEKVYH